MKRIIYKSAWWIFIYSVGFFLGYTIGNNQQAQMSTPCDTVLFHDLAADPVEMKWMVNCGGEWEPLEGPRADWLEDWLDGVVTK